MNRHTSNRRLLQLANFLDDLPPERFNYDRWVGLTWGGAQDLSCGTTACALGWAATMPTFRRLGLSLHDGRHGAGWVEHRSGLSGYVAGAKVFGLTKLESNFLFGPECTYKGRMAPAAEATPQEVADHIRRFVAERAVA